MEYCEMVGRFADQHIYPSKSTNRLLLVYTNIPSMETLDIIKNKLQNDTQGDTEWLKKAYYLINVTIKQNYFKANEKVWQETDGTPMGSPISSILAEIFLQEIGSRYYPNIIKNRQIVFLARYVDDIIIIVDIAHTSAELILKDHNDMHLQLKYKMEAENNQ
jgi:hypothetical protein